MSIENYKNTSTSEFDKRLNEALLDEIDKAKSKPLFVSKSRRTGTFGSLSGVGEGYKFRVAPEEAVDEVVIEKEPIVYGNPPHPSTISTLLALPARIYTYYCNYLSIQYNRVSDYHHEIWAKFCDNPEIINELLRNGISWIDVYNELKNHSNNGAIKSKKVKSNNFIRKVFLFDNFIDLESEECKSLSEEVLNSLKSMPSDIQITIPGAMVIDLEDNPLVVLDSSKSLKIKGILAEFNENEFRAFHDFYTKKGLLPTVLGTVIIFSRDRIESDFEIEFESFKEYYDHRNSKDKGNKVTEISIEGDQVELNEDELNFMESHKINPIKLIRDKLKGNLNRVKREIPEIQVYSGSIDNVFEEASSYARRWADAVPSYVRQESPNKIDDSSF